MTKGSRVLEKKVNETQVSETMFSHLNYKAANKMVSYSPNLEALEDLFEGLCSRMERLSLKHQKIKLAYPEDKIEEEIT